MELSLNPEEFPLNKYPLLKNINQEYLPTIYQEIFESGYNCWIRNFIKNDIVESQSNNITENKISSTKGQIGENTVIDIIQEKFPDFIVENTSKIPHAGDIQITLPSKKKMIIEVKNYNKTVDQDQIDKLKFDMKFSSITFAIFVSLNSGIVGKKRFDLDVFTFNKKNYHILYLPYSLQKTIPNKKYIINYNSFHESIYNLTLKIEFSICIMTSLINSILKSTNKSTWTTDLDYLIHQFSVLFEEFRSVKNSYSRLEENIKKALESHLNVIKDFEHNIKSKINKLVDKKLGIGIIKKPLSDTVFIKIDNESENYNIFYDSDQTNLIGKIVKIGNIYDLLINYDDIFISELFENFDECINFLHKI